MPEPPEPIVFERRSRPRVTRAEIEEIVHRRAHAARELQWLRRQGKRLHQILEAGALVEPGPAPVEIEKRWDGSRRSSAVVIDGRAVDDVG